MLFITKFLKWFKRLDGADIFIFILFVGFAGLLASLIVLAVKNENRLMKEGQSCLDAGYLSYERIESTVICITEEGNLILNPQRLNEKKKEKHND